MKSISSILPVVALCAALSACGNSETSNTTVSDTTTSNGSPLGNTASDNTGTGIEGGTVNTTPGEGANTTGAGTGTGTSGTNMGNESSGAASGSTVGGTDGGTTGTTGGTTSGAGGGSRTNVNRTGTRSDYPVKITKEDSVNNRSGLAPVK